VVEPRSVEQTAIAVAHAAWLAAEHAVAAADDMAARLSEAERFPPSIIESIELFALARAVPTNQPTDLFVFLCREKERKTENISLKMFFFFLFSELVRPHIRLRGPSSLGDRDPRVVGSFGVADLARDLGTVARESAFL